MTYDDFIIQFPQFATFEMNVVESQIATSTRLLDAAAWGNDYDFAVSLDCAHNLTLQSFATTGALGGMQGAAGPLTSASAAGMSASFATPNLSSKNISENWYMKTLYGQQFIRLRNAVFPAGILAC